MGEAAPSSYPAPPRRLGLLLRRLLSNLDSRARRRLLMLRFTLKERGQEIPLRQSMPMRYYGARAHIPSYGC